MKNKARGGGKLLIQRLVDEGSVVHNIAKDVVLEGVSDVCIETLDGALTGY